VARTYSPSLVVPFDVMDTILFAPGCIRPSAGVGVGDGARAKSSAPTDAENRSIAAVGGPRGHVEVDEVEAVQALKARTRKQRIALVTVELWLFQSHLSPALHLRIAILRQQF
jgi:hypothetical protein